jgi:hypothetical protein
VRIGQLAWRRWPARIRGLGRWLDLSATPAAGGSCDCLVRIRFLLPLPDCQAPEFWTTPARRNRRTPEQVYAAWEQACRQKWRAHALTITAKLEAVEAEITTLEDEFMAHIVLPDGSTFGQWRSPRSPTSTSTTRCR